MTPAANIAKYTAVARKRFGTPLLATQQDSRILFEFSVSGVLSHLEVDLGGDFTPTRVRSAFVELGLEIDRLQAGGACQEGRSQAEGKGLSGPAQRDRADIAAQTARIDWVVPARLWIVPTVAQPMVSGIRPPR